MARHLGALHADRFEIAALKKQKMITRLWATAVVLKSCATLKLWNLQGSAIFVRPARQTGTILLDDLDSETVARLAGEGFAPACVVETSPGNFQVWLRLIENKSGKELDSRVVSRAIRHLVEKYAADLNSADWRHYGRLGGFTNRKPAYAKEDGRFPYVLVHAAEGAIAAEGRALLLRAKKEVAEEETHTLDLEDVGFKKGPGIGLHAQRRTALLMRNLDRPWAASPDESILDWMIVCDALEEGWTPAAVSEMLAQRIGLELKHNVTDYVGRTVRKAIHHLAEQKAKGADDPD